MSSLPAIKDGKFYVSKSPKCAPDGNGCFARCAIKPHEIICTFEGKIYTLRDMMQRISSSLTRTVDDPLEIEAGLFMDIEAPFINFNHSCEPNAVLKNKCDLVAIRNIEPDEEITFDYSSAVPVDGLWIMSQKCMCGAERCRKTIGNITTIPKSQLDRYLEYGVQDFIRKQLKL
ncbi:MAG: SET domain-containing protein [Oligoflexales bacterium]|nr:SET domain-containing protein [Oligoflexales bacterium]